jgi:phage tail sheath gpL-like
MAGFPLTGIDPASPLPGVIREIKFARGASLGSGTQRNVIFLGNKRAGLTSGATADAIHPDAVQSEGDVIRLTGAGSELHLMYRAFTLIPQDAQIFLGVVAEASGGVANTVNLVLANTATANTALRIQCLGEQLDIPVANGDTVAVASAAGALAINRQIHWPIVADGTTTPGTIAISTKNVGKRFRHCVDQLVASITINAASQMTVTKGSVTADTALDDQSAVLDLVEQKYFYYQVNGFDTVNGAAAATLTNGVGEHASVIAAMDLPSIGKGQQMFFGNIGTMAQAVTAAVACNNARVFPVWAGDNQQWPSWMLAAHYCAIKRAKEVAHPGANLTGYGLESGEICFVPAPLSGGDEPTKLEQTSLLNGGVTPIAFSQSGRAYIVRSVTSYGGILTTDTSGVSADYRAREGHIPSVMDYFWEYVDTRYRAQAQDFVADDPAEGEKPLMGVTYPRDVKSLLAKAITDLTGPLFPAGPVLDPSQRDAMINSISVQRLTDGISARVAPIAVKHNNKGQFLIEEAGAGY